MRRIVGDLERLLADSPEVERDSVRVRFIRLAASSLDIELFAYIRASDWGPFLEIQQRLLLAVMETVERAGSSIAFPSQTVHIASGRALLGHTEERK
jgi:MscS family membrane protein